MILKNVLLAVRDMEKSVAFYKELFDLQVILDSDCYVMMNGGLVLQDIGVWTELLQKECTLRSHASELYFETYDMPAFLEKLRHRAEILGALTVNSFGRETVRLYDPDGHLIEVGSAFSQTVGEMKQPADESGEQR